MRYKEKYLLTAILLSVMLSPLIGQREVSCRVVLDDQQVPKEVQAGFKSINPLTIFSIRYTSHITYWYKDYAPSRHCDLRLY